MPTRVLTDAAVIVNDVDLSDHVQSVTVELSRETQDDTAMGHTARSNAPGLKTNSISATFLQNFDSSAVDDTLWSLYDDATSHTVEVRETSDSVGSDNPSYTLTGYIESYNPIGGSVGDQHTTDVSWVNGSSTGVARATS